MVHIFSFCATWVKLSSKLENRIDDFNTLWFKLLWITIYTTRLALQQDLSELHKYLSYIQIKCTIVGVCDKIISMPMIFSFSRLKHVLNGAISHQVVWQIFANSSPGLVYMMGKNRPNVESHIVYCS